MSTSSVFWSTIPIASPRTHFERAGEPPDVLLRGASEVMTLREMAGFNPDTTARLYVLMLPEEIADDMLRATAVRIRREGRSVGVYLVLFYDSRAVDQVDTTDSAWW